ncbi:MAG: M28 family peptidase [Alphaproteobacteria bacterium]|jgi:Zn-dependent M28 family amino/carboxypeptidase|nr:M28 family peptidase [Alphaproteobacteria bacterium]MBU2041782.1 M28 family peptidase [Alphaproteobacteria bacterium]MBU2209346.1 M28 family peptidase [Alphaproteobacteria bacterium]MBU2291226.1 M28 family peptidase [Alphaproteobacteria bacterium]MBU2396164.1 M28 family peptidase [Alphaproteobacteria bacterium]
MRASRLTLFASVALLALSAGGALAQQAEGPRLNEHVRVLASDEFEGRGVATPGEQLTVDYLVGQFQALGLEPGGPDGSWVQTAQLGRTRQAGPATITVTANGETRALERGPQLLVSSDRPVDRITVTDAEMVFAGYGVDAPERNWDDFKDVDVRGKILLVIVNDPDFAAPEGHPVADRFDGNAMTFYGRWTYKFQEAAERGAAGVLVIHDTAGAGYPWSVLEGSSTAPKFDIVRADPEAERVPAQGWIQGPEAERMFVDAGLDYAALRAAARTEAFRPVTLEGVTMSIDFGQTADRIESRNVLARIPGTAHPDETVLYGAHWDAYGRATPVGDDDIYNGAVDNATGLAALIELARLFKAGEAPERSVVFAAWTAEEAGLLGAEYYAANPVWPLETTVANINIDSFLPGAEASPQIVVMGAGKSETDAWLERRATEQGRTLIPDPAPQAGGFYRSDHFPLAKMGVPALFGAAGFTGHNEASRDYVANRYHKPSDEWTSDWVMDGAAVDVDLLYLVGRDMADSRDWPEWNAGAEFEAARQASAAARR